MIPVVDLNQVHVAWIEIRGEGFVLYGFMLYSDEDAAIVEFMERSGLAELDELSGPECAIFVIESPSQRWVEYARRHNHPWWRLFGDRTHSTTRQPSQRIAAAADLLLQYRSNVLIAISDDERVSLRHFVEPNYGALYDRREIWEVVRHFGLTPQEVPCLVFFRDLDDGDIDVVCLRDVRTPRQATLAFRDYFGGHDFQRLITEARRYA